VSTFLKLSFVKNGSGTGWDRIGLGWPGRRVELTKIEMECSGRRVLGRFAEVGVTEVIVG
jgi:hypothetical protein